MKPIVSSPTVAAWLVSGATVLGGGAAHAIVPAPQPEATASAAVSAAKPKLIKPAPKPIQAPVKTGGATVPGKGDEVQIRVSGPKPPPPPPIMPNPENKAGQIVPQNLKNVPGKSVGQ
jgi:hypothetical protein